MSRLIIAIVLSCLFVSLFAKQNLVRTFRDSRGRLVDEYRMPEVPVGQRNSGPVVVPTATAVMVPDVPTFDWSYGCFATSAAMLAGYYDRNGYDNIYTGPANGGVVPLTNSVWGPGECPLSATHQGYDNLTTLGHVNRFFVAIDNQNNDPFGGGNPTGTYANCTADYMGTNQDWWDNKDGNSWVYTKYDGSKLYDDTEPETSNPRRRDAIHGLKLFFNSRGYAVQENYNQKIYGFEGLTDGFTFGNYMDCIAAGRPVFIHVSGSSGGHTMLGVGYDSATQTVYLHDTWNHDLHSMTWGGSYSGMTQFAVSVLYPKGAIITANPNRFDLTMGPNQTVTQYLTIGNTGVQPLQYTLTCPPPTSTTNSLDQSFSTTTIPLGWAQQYDNGAGQWVFDTGGGYDAVPNSAYDGSYNAVLWSNSLSVVTLVSPYVNLSNTISASLSFWHAQGAWYGNQDTLRVYYKTSSNGTWNPLATYTNDTPNWTNENLALPNLSSRYYIGFKGTACGGHGVCIDNVVINKVVSTGAFFNVDGGTTYIGNIPVGGASNVIPININTTGKANGTYYNYINVSANSTNWRSSSFVVLVNVNTANTITLTPIPTGTTWQGGITQNISWSYSGTGSTVSLYYSSNGGTNWTSAGDIPTVPGTNTYGWTLPIVSSTNVVFKLVDSIAPNYSVSSTAFTIILPNISVNKTSMAFGILLANTTATDTFSISNTGTVPLSGNITTPTGYSVDISRGTDKELTMSKNNTQRKTRNADLGRNTLSYTVPANSSASFTVTFAPILAQAYNGNVSITHNAAGNTKTISLTGQGITKPTIAISDTVFTIVDRYTLQGVLNVNFANIGSKTLHYSLALSGTVSWLTNILFDDGINAVSGTSFADSIAVGADPQYLHIEYLLSELPAGTHTATFIGTSDDPARPTFTITVTAIGTSTVSFISPAGGEIWAAGSVQTISWNYSGTGHTVLMQYTTNGGANWSSAVRLSTVQGVNTATWELPNVTSSNCKITLKDFSGGFYTFTSNLFTIEPAPTIPTSVNSTRYPATGDIVLTWGQSIGLVHGYKIYSSLDGSFQGDNKILEATTDPSTRSFTIPAASTVRANFYRVTAY